MNCHSCGAKNSVIPDVFGRVHGIVLETKQRVIVKHRYRCKLCHESFREVKVYGGGEQDHDLYERLIHCETAEEEGMAFTVAGKTRTMTVRFFTEEGRR